LDADNEMVREWFRHLDIPRQSARLHLSAQFSVVKPQTLR
jgi:hypothetical protein